jgi:hypothetical protein
MPAGFKTLAKRKIKRGKGKLNENESQAIIEIPLFWDSLYIVESGW